MRPPEFAFPWTEPRVSATLTGVKEHRNKQQGAGIAGDQGKRDVYEPPTVIPLGTFLELTQGFGAANKDKKSISAA